MKKLKEINFNYTYSSGLTLIEVIAVIAIIMMILLPIFKIFILNNNIIKNTTRKIEAKDAVTKIQEYIIDEVRLAKRLEIGITTPSVVAEEGNIYMKDGNLYQVNRMYTGASITYRTNIVYSKELLGDFDIFIDFEKKADYILGVRVKAVKEIFGVPTILYEEDAQCKMINMEVMGPPNIINGAITGSYISYKIPR